MQKLLLPLLFGSFLFLFVQCKTDNSHSLPSELASSSASNLPRGNAEGYNGRIQQTAYALDPGVSSGYQYRLDVFDNGKITKVDTLNLSTIDISPSTIDTLGGPLGAQSVFLIGQGSEIYSVLPEPPLENQKTYMPSWCQVLFNGQKFSESGEKKGFIIQAERHIPSSLRAKIYSEMNGSLTLSEAFSITKENSPNGVKTVRTEDGYFFAEIDTCSDKEFASGLCNKQSEFPGRLILNGVEEYPLTCRHPRFDSEE